MLSVLDSRLNDGVLSAADSWWSYYSVLSVVDSRWSSMLSVVDS